MSNIVNVIAIDGPSSSGKGTIAKEVAKKLHFNYLDSGAIYRCIAYLLQEKNVELEDITTILQLIENMQLMFKDAKIYLNHIDITNNLRDESIGLIASNLAKNENIRNKILPYQRSFLNLSKGLVADGRDMGSVVFPDAKLKIFLTANELIRAKRRFLQLQILDHSVKMEAILRDIKMRDLQDISREVSPLTYDSTYKVLDNTNLSIEECVNQILAWYHEL